jgi:hypothetical protein
MFRLPLCSCFKIFIALAIIVFTFNVMTCLTFDGKCSKVFVERLDTMSFNSERVDQREYDIFNKLENWKCSVWVKIVSEKRSEFSTYWKHENGKKDLCGYFVSDQGVINKKEDCYVESGFEYVFKVDSNNDTVTGKLKLVCDTMTIHAWILICVVLMLMALCLIFNVYLKKNESNLKKKANK